MILLFSNSIVCSKELPMFITTLVPCIVTQHRCFKRQSLDYPSEVGSLGSTVQTIRTGLEQKPSYGRVMSSSSFWGLKCHVGHPVIHLKHVRMNELTLTSSGVERWQLCFTTKFSLLPNWSFKLLFPYSYVSTEISDLKTSFVLSPPAWIQTQKSLLVSSISVNTLTHLTHLTMSSLLSFLNTHFVLILTK